MVIYLFLAQLQCGDLMVQTFKFWLLDYKIMKNIVEKNITMRNNSGKDMEEKLKDKYPNATVIYKGSVHNNFGAGGFKYYQHFWCKILNK